PDVSYADIARHGVHVERAGGVRVERMANVAGENISVVPIMASRDGHSVSFLQNAVVQEGKRAVGAGFEAGVFADAAIIAFDRSTVFVRVFPPAYRTVAHISIVAAPAFDCEILQF